MLLFSLGSLVEAELEWNFEASGSEVSITCPNAFNLWEKKMLQVAPDG